MTQLTRRSLLGSTTVGAAATGLSTGLIGTPAQAAPFRTARRRDRVERLLARMTLAEKIGQLRLANTAEDTEAALRTTGCGGVFSVVGAAQLNALQQQALQTRLAIPLIVGLDVIHGYTTNFPIPLGQAASWDPEVAASDARTSAAEARRSGITWTYAPMMDVSHEPRWGRIAEGNGEDPYLTTRFAVAKTKAYQGADLARPDTLAACAKHYVGYGQPEGGRDYNTVDVSIQRLHNTYLPPFRACVEAGIATVMASFNTISGVPAHANAYTIREVLKQRYGFDGFVVSDYTGIQELIPHGIAGNGTDAAREGIRAGVDMEMTSTNYVEHARDLLRTGAISQREIDDAVRRILTVKDDLGLFDNPFVDPAGETVSVSAQARAAARTAAARSLVLLRNENGVLPLSKGRTVAVVGPLGTATYDLNGTWSGLGTGASTTEPTTVLDAIKAISGGSVTYTPGCAVDDTDTSGIDAAVAAARAADVCVLVLGETAAMSGEAAARSDIGLPGVQQQLADRVGAAQPHTVAVLLNGRPLTLTQLAAAVPAILEAFAPGLEGGNAIADALFGITNPGGKLPVSFPRSVGQVPIYYNHENTGRPYDPDNKYTSKYLDLPDGPLYEFGFGLSYTSFEVSGVRFSSDTLPRRHGRVTVAATVRNTGARAGDEVVQLYLHDPVASIVQPVRRLRGFERVTLAPGEQRTVRFTLTREDVGFYDDQARFIVEPGQVEVYVGTSSDQATKAGVLTVR
ncbi:beta-glucosidase BglX [Nocardioides mangrovicus]|uniref:Exo-alpha-(1->6)-L-arabinopyranosidase n=1 Tax=Nocardioides mangrovicus TaxID=2478913 RepID=A0A3L8P4G2_9ACTN|nr:beta-glucosidase BglX [Nocardioides mangrovicus]RLV49952.1 beta-glucosidase BglX [Nocardioides mangrovicus]